MSEVARLEAVIALQRAFAAAVVDDTFDEACSAVARGAGSSGAWLARLSHGRFEQVGACLRGSPARFGAIGAEQVPSLVRRSASLALLSDAERNGFFGAECTQAIGLPLITHDAVVGALVVLGDDSFELGPEAAVLLVQVADSAAMAVQSIGTLRELRASQREHLALLDALDLMIVVTDPGGGVRQVNRALRQRIGTGPSVFGRPADTLFAGQHLPTVGDHPRTTLTGPQGEPLRAAAYPLQNGGSVVVVQDVRGASAPRMHAAGSTMPALRRQPTPRVARARVLVLDDEPSILRAIGRTLSPYHEVLTAPDGVAGVALLESDPDITVVVTDIQMPRLGGLDLYRWIEQNRPALAPRVLFVTGGVFDPETERFLRSMASRVLRKPFDPEALRRAVDERTSV